MTPVYSEWASRLGASNLLPAEGMLFYIPEFLSKQESSAFYQEICETEDWQQREIQLFGKTHLQPRLISWQGSVDYTYSGTRFRSSDWSAPVAIIRRRVEEHVKQSFNGVLINYYRHGSDSMGWHSDDEKELGNQPVIASVSLGEIRTIRFRHKKREHPSTEVLLEPGSLMVMCGPTQCHWQHAIPKRSRPLMGRINLTFRKGSRS